jgi:hypothetical protein
VLDRSRLGLDGFGCSIPKSGRNDSTIFPGAARKPPNWLRRLAKWISHGTDDFHPVYLRLPGAAPKDTLILAEEAKGPIAKMIFYVTQSIAPGHLQKHPTHRFDDAPLPLP